MDVVVFKVIDNDTNKVLFESRSWDEAYNMAQFFDENCRIE